MTGVRHGLRTGFYKNIFAERANRLPFFLGGVPPHKMLPLNGNTAVFSSFAR
jgi:hypothetical protein